MAISDFYPNEKELALINSRSIDLHKKNSGISLLIQAADNEIDRGDDQFQNKALDSLAKKAIENRIPLLFAQAGDKSEHCWMSKNNVGWIYDAYVDNGKLFYKAFLPFSKTNDPIIENIINSNYSKVSVGFSISPEDYVCSLCNNSIMSSDCEHYPGQDGCYTKIMDTVDNFEVSFATVPMQRSAHVVGKGVNNIMSETKTVKDAEGNEYIVPVDKLSPLNPPDPVAKKLDEINENLQKALNIDVTAKVDEELVKKTAELESANKSLTDELTQLKEQLSNKNSDNDKITNDTEQDNNMSEDNKEKEVSQAPDLSEVRHGELVKGFESINTGINSLAESMKSLVEALGKKEVAPAEVEAKSKEPAKKNEDNTNERSTKSLEDRLHVSDVIQKSVNDKLWDRLNMPLEVK